MSVFDFPGAARASDDTTIKNSYFHGTHQALSIGSGNNIKIYNNVFANNGASGCVVGSAIDVSTWNTYTVNTQHTENTQIYNNTFYTNTGSYALGYGNPAVSQQVISTTVRNNIFYQNYSNDAIDPNVTGVSGYVGGTNLCGTAGSNGCQLNGIPNFVNAAGGNFQLNSPSPAIDTGATIALVSPDRAGVARPQPPGGAYDIGAYEFVNTTGVPHLASISPMSTTVGTASVAVTLTGTTLTCTSATLTITGGSGLTASNVACGSATTITATLSATSASVGTYAISATLNGTTATDNSVNFTVNPIPVTACNNTSVGNGVTCILSASAATTDGMSVSLMAFNATGANTLVMSVGSSDGNCTPSSTPANTWVLATPHGTPPTHRFFVAYNAAVSNSMTISCTATASEYPAMSVAAFSGIYAAGNPIDKVNGGYGTAATLATGSVTPSNAPQLVLAGWAGTETSSLSIDSGFTIYEHLPSIQGSYWSSALAMKTVSPAAATSATWTQAMAFEAGTTIMTLATNALPQTGACANTNLANGVTCTASASAISTDTITVSIPSFNPGSGSFLVLSTAQYSAGTLCHPTSTPSVNWQPINPQSNPAVTSAVSQMFYATGVTGTISITCNSGGTATASYPAISVAAFSGIIAVAPLDQFTGAAGNSPLFTKVVTPRNANQLIVAGLNQASVASTIDSGFAIHENLPADGSGNSYGTALAMKTVGTPAATSATWTIGSGSSGATTIATFLTNALPLTFVQQPTNTPSGQPFMPVIKVQVPQ
jgi:hypothetical protein